MRLALVLGLAACAGPGSGKVAPTPTETEPTTPTGTGPTACPAVTGFSVSAGALLLDGVIDVDLEGAGHVWAVCARDDDPADAILVESTAPAAHQQLHVYGLAAGATYHCELRATCPGAPADTFDVQTSNVGEHDGWTVSADPAGGMSGTWTLFNDQNECTLNPFGRLFIIDPEGRVRWSYGYGSGYVIDMDSAYIGDGVVHLGGGWGLFEESEPHRGVQRQVDLSGNVLLERTQPAFGLGFNHHSEVLPDGQILGLTTSRDSGDGRSWYGVAIEQWNPATEAVTWSWSSQQLFDDGTFPAQIEDSPWHANSVTLHDDAWGPAAWVSLYYGNMIWRIDRNTGQLTHRFGPGGDFTLVDASGNALPDSDFAWVSHDPDYTDDGRVLVYDNGVDRPGGNASRVTEYRLDLDTLVATRLWTWTEPGWYEPVIGDADYLPNGNVLVTRGHVWCFDFTPGHSALIELEPGTDREVWRLDYDTQSNGIFRSERYDGCEIFSNGKYCPAVAARIDALRAL